MSRDYYIKESLRILDDRATYQILEKNPTLVFQKELEQLLNKSRDMGIINEEEWKYLLNENCKIAIFYFLPKLHKNI